MPTPMNLEGYRRPRVEAAAVPIENVEPKPQPSPSLFSKAARVMSNKVVLLGLASLLVTGAWFRFMGWFGIGPALITLLVSFVTVIVVYLLRKAIAYVIFCFVGGAFAGAAVGAVLAAFVCSIAAAISFMSGQVLAHEFWIDGVAFTAALLGYTGLCGGALYCGLTIQENCF